MDPYDHIVPRGSWNAAHARERCAAMEAAWASCAGLEPELQHRIMLMSMGADLKTASGESFVAAAAMHRDWDTVAFLLDHGVCVDTHTIAGESLLALAVAQHDGPVAALLSRGAHADARNAAGEPLVATAAFAGRWAEALALLDAGASVHAHTLGGESLVSTAAQHFHGPVAALLSRGAHAAAAVQ